MESEKVKVKTEKDAEEKAWGELLKTRKALEESRKEYNEKRTLESIERLDKACAKFNKAMEVWRQNYDLKIKEHSVYIPARS